MTKTMIRDTFDSPHWNFFATFPNDEVCVADCDEIADEWAFSNGHGECVDSNGSEIEDLMIRGSKVSLTYVGWGREYSDGFQFEEIRLRVTGEIEELQKDYPVLRIKTMEKVV